MDFGKINPEFGFSANYNAKKNISETSKENKEVEGSYSPLPNNPKYWQNSTNLSFKGKDNDTVFNEALIAEASKPLVESSLLTEKEINLFTGILDMPYFIKDKDKELKSAVLILRKLKDNPEKIPYFKNIISPKISDGAILPSCILELLSEDLKAASNKNDILDFFINSPSQTSVAPIRSSEELVELFSMLDEKSLEELKQFSKETNEGGAYLYYKMKEFINPETKLFDKTLCDFAFELQDKDPRVFGSRYDLTKASALARECVDMQTGKLSPIALEFIRKYCFNEPQKDTISSKIKNVFDFKKRKMSKFGAGFYESFMFNNLAIYSMQLLKDNNGAFNEKNAAFLSKVVELPLNINGFSYVDTIKSLKNENGIIDDKKAEIFFDLYDPAYRYTAVSPFSKNKTNEMLIEKIIKAYDSYPPDKKNEMLSKCKKLFKKNQRLGIALFPQLSSLCFDKDGNLINENYNTAKTLISAKCTDMLMNGTIIGLLKSYCGDFEFNINDLDFTTKVQLISDVNKMISSLNKKTDKNLISKLTDTISLIDKNLNGEDISLDVSKENRDKFITGILSSNKKLDNGLTEFENVMISSIPKLKEMKEGLPLTYTKQQFLSDLSLFCLNDDKLKEISELLEVDFDFEKNKEMIKLKGYNGIIRLDKLNRDDEFQNALYQICHKFLYENEINSGNKELDKFLNTIIKASPEFINTIGKPQHGTHKYTLDIHQLLVLANSINNPDYNKLNNTDKTMLKLSTIFHDIAKEENKVDKGHQFPSSLYARSIIKKFFKNPESRDRVYELIKNHHWLEEFSNSNNKEEISKDLAYRFRRPNDFEIAKIMAKSDLMSVSDEFYESHKSALEDDTLSYIQSALNQIYQTGPCIMSDYFIGNNFSNLETCIIDGDEYKVLNLHKIDDNEDLGKYGFMPGRTKKDINLLVHMVSKGNIKGDLSVLDNITSSVNGGVLSESLITPYYKRTYQDRKYGVLLSQINANLINIDSSNQGSGNKKDIKDVLELIFGYSKDARINFREHFLKNLGFETDEISNEEYGRFYKDNLVLRTSIKQIPDNKTFQLGNKLFKGSEIKKAIIEYQNSLIDKTQTKHNEIIGFAPKINAVIAKEKDIKDVPSELLSFAKKDNLPVILI